MSLPEHLHPKTYWERRCELLEASIERLVYILGNYSMPPAGNQALADHMRVWSRLLGELQQEFPAPAGIPASPKAGEGS
jgi:hypothetical protein